MRRDSSIAGLLFIILAFSAIIYTLIKYAVIDPARRMEDDLMQVAHDFDAKGDLVKAISTLETLYERRYCYKRCLSTLGAMENRRGGHPAAVIYCRESLNTDMSKCSNVAALTCMVDAYTALAQTSKVFTFQEHLLHCGALPMHESLGLLEHFLSTNATARALNVLTMYHMYDAASDDVKAQAAAVLQAHRFGSGLLQQRKAAKRNRTIAKGPEVLSTPVGVAGNVSEATGPLLAPPVSAVYAEATGSFGSSVVVPSAENEALAAAATVDDTAAASLSEERSETALSARSAAEPSARDPAATVATAAAPNDTATATEEEQAPELSLSQQPQSVDAVAVAVSVDGAAVDVSSVDRDAAPVATAAETAAPIDVDATDATAAVPPVASATAADDAATAAATGDTTTAAPLVDSVAVAAAAATAEATAASTASTDPAGAAKEPAAVRPTPPTPRPSPQDNLRRVARSYVGMAQSLVQQGDALAAMKKLALALKKVPQFEDALLLRGALYVQQQDYDKAVTDLHVVYRLSNETFGNATAGALLCQVAHSHRRRQQWSAAAAVFATLFDVERALGWPLLMPVRRESTAGTANHATANDADTDDAADTDDTDDERSSRCMGRDTLLLYADLLGHQLGRFAEAVAVLDALQAAVADDATLRQQLQLPLEQRYLVFLEASGDLSRADGLYRAALDAGTLSPLDFADVLLLRRNDTDAALALYRAEESRLRAELAVVTATLSDAADAAGASTDATTRRQQLQSRQQLKRAQSSLGGVLKRLGHVYHAVLAEGDVAAALYAEAMALGVYDRDVRRYLAAVGAAPAASPLSTDASADDAAASSAAVATTAEAAAVDTADASDASDAQSAAGDAHEAVQPLTEAGAAEQGHSNAHAAASAEGAARPREWHFPHRRLQLPLLFPHFRWVVRPVGRATQLPHGGVDRSLSHQQREPRGFRLGGASMATLLEQLDAAQSEGGQAGADVYATDDDEDDLIREGDSSFEQERKRKLQESRAQARREDVERQRRRDSAFFATDTDD